MRKYIAAFLAALMLAGCGSTSVQEVHNDETAVQETEAASAAVSRPEKVQSPEITYVSRFDTVTEIALSDDGITVNAGQETAAVFTTNDIIYYEDLETYASGNPYGEGEQWQRHTAEEAAAHTVVNITQPGAYRVTGHLSAGQIRVDLGADSYYNEDAVVELILQDADITCTVAPAVLFLNTYECDAGWSTETATAAVDTTAAGANLILEGSNTVTGSHVAKIFKDKDGEKKLWKQDGAIYSYMSMNVYGPGILELTADNEGMDTELHLTINGGNISIYSGNDGINTNEDGVSVTTINGGELTILAGLDKEGDGIDSNGYLVINGGTVVAAAHPAADAGLDSDLGSYINGGTVIAMGSTMDWAESDSEQVTMNLQFAGQQEAGSKILITTEDGTEVFAFDTDGQYARPFSGLILSSPGFAQGATYHVYINGVQMAYTDTDVRRGPGGMGRPGGMPMPSGEMPEGMEPPEGFDPSQWQNGEMPEDFDPGKFFGSPGETGETQTGFYMNDKVNAFSGVTAA